MFDERVATARARALGLWDDRPETASDSMLAIRQIEPTEMSPGEFATLVVRAVEEADASLVVIDSLNGYLQSMPNGQLMTVHVHELLSYMSSRGVTTIMTLVQRGVLAPRSTTRRR
jgi:circadian clock protein KaiC